MTPPSRGTDTKTTTEADSPPLRTECVGTNPITLDSQKLGPRRQPMDYRLDLRPRLQPFHGRSNHRHPPLFTQNTVVSNYETDPNFHKRGPGIWYMRGGIHTRFAREPPRSRRQTGTIPLKDASQRTHTVHTHGSRTHGSHTLFTHTNDQE